MTNFLFYSFVAMGISLLAVAQFRVALGELELPLLFFVVMAGFFLRIVGGGRDFFVRRLFFWRALEIALFSFLLMLLLYGFDVLRTDGDPRVVQAIVKLCFGILVFLFFAFLDLRESRFSGFLAFFSTVVVGYYVFNSYFVLGSPYLVNSLDEVTKAGKNQIALYLSAVSVLLFYQAFSCGRRKRLVLLVLWGAFAIHFVALIYCSSRSAWVSFVLAILPILAVLRHRIFIPAVLISIFFVAILPMLIGGDVSQSDDMLESISARAMSIFSAEDPSGEGSIALRGELIVHALHDFVGSPLIGIGAEQFVRRHDYVTHNSYLQFLVENGVLGFVVFVVPVLIVLRVSFVLSKRSILSGILDERLTLLMPAVTFLVNIGFVNILGAPIFFVILGLAFGQMRLLKD